MADLTVQNIVEAGVVPALVAAAAGGDAFVNDDQQRTFFVINNGSGSSINVTFTAQNTSAQVPGFGSMTKGDRVVAVAAAARKHIGPFPPAFNDAAGKVQVGYSLDTSVTVAVMSLPKVP